ncbi:MAG: hypothetical protein WCD38_00060 [Candidatus Tumulicola sp.]
MRIQSIYAAALVLVFSACNAAGTNQSVPSAPTGSGMAVGASDQMPAGVSDDVQPAADHTSILKMLNTETTVASTVDPLNGDKRPHGLVYVNSKPFGKSILQKGDLVVCNFNDSSGTPGKGTTMEYMSSVPGSSPTQLTQSSSLLGCASLVLSPFDAVYSADEGAKDAVGEDSNGKIKQTLKSSQLVEPWGSAYVPSQTGYPPGDGLWVSDASTGKIVRINLGTGGKPTYTPVISGFAVNKGKPGHILAPSGLQYNEKTDTLYVIDGVNDTVVSFSHAYNDFNVANEVVVGSNGTTFTGPKAKDAKLIYHGAPLSAPIGSTLLPNGNLVIGNTGNEKGKNLLVEISTDGKVLAYKNVNKGNGGALFGIAASGSSDSNTVIYFNNGNTNAVQVLTK